MLGLAMILFASSYRATAIGAEHSPSMMLSAMRAAPAAPVLLAAVPLLRGRLPRGRTAAWAAATGLAMVALFNVGITVGTARAGAGNTSVLINTIPFWVLLLGFFLLHERVTRLAVLGLAMGFGGVVVLVSSQLGGSRDAGSFALGVFVALASAIGYGGGMLIVKAIVERQPDLDFVGFNAIQFTAGGIALLAIGFGVDGTAGTEWGSGDFWGAVLYLALVTAAIGTLAFLGALRRLSATKAAAASFTIPGLAVLIEIGYGNTPSGIALGGMALTIVGVALVNVAPEQLARLLRRGRRSGLGDPLSSDPAGTPSS